MCASGQSPNERSREVSCCLPSRFEFVCWFLTLARLFPRKARNAEGPGVPDVEGEAVEEDEEGEDEGPQARARHEGDVIEETIFTFESFELVSVWYPPQFQQRASEASVHTLTHMHALHASRAVRLRHTLIPTSQKFANSDITQSLLTYLGRYKEFTSPDEMKRIVSLLHRQAVRAKAEGLFFQVCCFFRVSGPILAFFSPFVLRPGIRTEPVQNRPRGSEVVPQGPAVQRSRSAHQLHTPSILQGRRGGLIRTYRGNVYSFFSFSVARGAETRIFLFSICSCSRTTKTDALPEEPKPMEKVLQLGTGGKE